MPFSLRREVRLRANPNPKPKPNPNPNSNPNRDQVTASSDQTARLWDVASGETIRHYTGHHKAVIAVALHDRMNTVPGGGAA